jgi:hypothetical protein
VYPISERWNAFPGIIIIIIIIVAVVVINFSLTTQLVSHFDAEFKKKLFSPFLSNCNLRLCVFMQCME